MSCMQGKPSLWDLGFGISVSCMQGKPFLWNLGYELSVLRMQGKPSLWNSILEAEDNEDDVERFQDMPESPTHASGLEAAQALDAEEEADDVRQQQLDSRDKAADREVNEDHEEEEEEDGDMAPSTTGQGQVESGEGPLQGSAPAGPPGAAPMGYDMRKRY